MLAELLAHVIARAVVDTLAPRPVLHLPGRTADLSPAQVCWQHAVAAGLPGSAQPLLVPLPPVRSLPASAQPLLVPLPPVRSLPASAQPLLGATAGAPGCMLFMSRPVGRWPQARRNHLTSLP